MTGLLVQDWIERVGGAEQVFRGMRRTFPQAECLALWNDQRASGAGPKIHETVLRYLPRRGRKALSVPLAPWIWRHSLATRGGFDWLLVSSHSFAHHVRVPPDTVKLVYAHTPARYLWVPELDRRGKVPLARVVTPALRHLDRSRSTEAAAIAVNSRYIRDRVRDSWARDSTVIYPPVRVEFIQESARSHSLTPAEEALCAALPAEFILGASRFVPYKRLDLVISAGEISGLPVVLAGGGPMAESIRQQARDASVPVTIVPSPSDALLFWLYEHTLTFVFPPVEDFGIMPVEAAASGAPVVVNRVGGARETIVPGRTGAAVDFDSLSDVRRGLETALGCDRTAAMENAMRFSEDAFQKNLRDWTTPFLQGLN